jgi:hypothetical protein
MDAHISAAAAMDDIVDENHILAPRGYAPPALFGVYLLAADIDVVEPLFRLVFGFTLGNRNINDYELRRSSFF